MNLIDADKTFANMDVLRFYQAMPFNYGSTAEIESRDFIRNDIFKTSYVFLLPLLLQGGGVIF